ncbi:MAG: cytochrome c biogenesis protein CcdA [Endomicrobiales bacterium]|nr:cytochrome c biogenesis protein CcdA [Endomicrobiales bacterium]
MSPAESIPGLLASFVAGILTFVSPCVLPLIPAYLSFITGASLAELEGGRQGAVKRSFISALFFVAGFSAIFILLGASASFLGAAAAGRRDIIRYVGGAVVVIFGLHLAGVFRIKLLYMQARADLKKPSWGYAGSFLVGVAFAVGWTPCVGPILSSILILASSQGTVSHGVLLLIVYSSGLGIPFLLTALFVGKALSLFSKIKKHYRLIEIISGAILVAVGVLLLTDSFNAVAGRITMLFG